MTQSAPQYLVDLVNKIGGFNMFGSPNFRLIRAEDRRMTIGGKFTNWESHIAVKDRDRRKRTPWSTTIGFKEVPRYGPITGWVLEKWVPSVAYGSRDRWYAPASLGGTLIFVKDGLDLRYIPSQGEYPSLGDYEYTGILFPTNEHLSEATVIGNLQDLIRSHEELPTNPMLRISRQVRATKAANEYLDKQYDEWAMDVLNEASPAFGINPMSGYGEKRSRSVNQTLKKLGIRSHSGAS